MGQVEDEFEAADDLVAAAQLGDVGPLWAQDAWQFADERGDVLHIRAQGVHFLEINLREKLLYSKMFNSNWLVLNILLI